MFFHPVQNGFGLITLGRRIAYLHLILRRTRRLPPAASTRTGSGRPPTPSRCRQSGAATRRPAQTARKRHTDGTQMARNAGSSMPIPLSRTSKLSRTCVSVPNNTRTRRLTCLRAVNLTKSSTSLIHGSGCSPLHRTVFKPTICHRLKPCPRCRTCAQPSSALSAARGASPCWPGIRAWRAWRACRLRLSGLPPRLHASARVSPVF